MLALRLTNLAASAAVIGLACAAYPLYRFIPQHQRQLSTVYGSSAFSFSGTDFLVSAALAYVALLAVHYLRESQPRASKSLLFFRVLLAFARSPATVCQQGLTPEHRVALLSTLLKAFFAPLMAMSLMVFCMGALAHGHAIVMTGASADELQTLFDRHGFWFLMQLILFVDVLVFTIGYLVELPRLRNEIRSVDPTLLGWASALLCYPPFNTLTGAILGSQVTDFPRFDDPTSHLALNLLLLLLMAVYASASVALGFKGSNLTHRGIVARGPYALVRHPAYTCKNMAWWIASLPLVAAAFSESLVVGVQALASVVGWTLLYALRALTEEEHLRSVDGEYAAYAARVRYRFIPGLL